MAFPTGPTTPVILGIDYGTTGTGVAYSRPVRPTSLNYPTPNVYKSWPAGRSEGKVPSKIAYLHDNPTGGFQDGEASVWGYKVRSGMLAYAWTKLLLDRDAPLTEFDDADSLRIAEPLGIFRHLEMAAADVVADYLRHIYHHLPTILNFRGDLCPALEFIFPTPATWSAEAMTLTEVAVRRAGFGQRDGDRLVFVSEPEAAAWGVLHSSQYPLMVNDGVLICDCGGGTVDVATIQVTGLDPQLSWRKVTAVQGGRCAGAAIDIRFHGLMLERFGTAFEQVELRFKGPGSHFMKDFELNKRAFSGRPAEPEPAFMRLNMNIPRTNSMGYAGGFVKISNQDLHACFDPVVDRIGHIIESQLNAASQLCGPIVKHIVLVGGLSESPYLQTAIAARFSTSNITVTVPAAPRLAVAQGASQMGICARQQI